MSGGSSPSASHFFSLPHTPSLTPYTTAPSYPSKEFPRLLRPEIYHPLTHLTTPAPFRSSSNQPSPETPIQTLLATGHFRAAAIAAAQILTTSTSPTDVQAIFSLFYVRLACLTLCGSMALAAQEATALEDLNSSIYRDDATGTHLVPWELRVLAVRLQGVGFNDPRKGVMGYYDLARELRTDISKLRGKGGDVNEERAMLEARLADLGIRVASALIEMEELDGAVCHLSKLSTIPLQFPQIRLQKALLLLQLGDVAAAQKCVVGDSEGDKIVAALSDMADGKYGDAVEAWKALCERDESNTLYSQNLAVCLLYAGRMDEVRTPVNLVYPLGSIRPAGNILT